MHNTKDKPLNIVSLVLLNHSAVYSSTHTILFTSPVSVKHNLRTCCHTSAVKNIEIHRISLTAQVLLRLSTFYFQSNVRAKRPGHFPDKLTIACPSLRDDRRL